MSREGGGACDCVWEGDNSEDTGDAEVDEGGGKGYSKRDESALFWLSVGKGVPTIFAEGE